MSNTSSGGPGLRILSFDGGDLRIISQLDILEEIIHRLEWNEDVEEPSKPARYFDMIVGTGTS
ncbi:hypothetical protein FRC15_008132, partial [Serendipita sp. 397]